MAPARHASRAAPNQFSFDFAGPPASPPIPHPAGPRSAGLDPLAARIIAAGLAPNDAVLTINRALMIGDTRTLPAPWNLPSRLFQWPIAYEPGTPDEPGQLRLRHPALAEHPRVRAIRARIPEPEHWTDAPEPGDHLAWNHAVDLMTPRLWPELIATRHFVDDAMIATALAFALQSPARLRGAREAWTLPLAREILSRLDAPEPNDRSRALIAGPGLMPARIDNRIVPNIAARGVAAAWLTIHGLEDGYLAHCRSGWLGVTAAGLALRAEHGRA